MGVVERQSFKYSFVGYFGFLFGTLCAIFLFPRDMAFYGKLRYILPAAEMLLPMVVMGLSYSNVKFYPLLKENNHQYNLLSHSFIGICINFVVVSLVFFASSLVFPSLKNSQIWELKYYIFPLLLFISLSHLMNRYISNFKRIAVPSILDNLFPKIANLLAFSLVFFFGIHQKIALIYFLVVFFIALLIYWFYLNRLDKIRLKWSTNYLRKNQLGRQILVYSFFGFLGNVGNYISLRIDNIMITEFFDLEQNGIYSTLYSIVSLISVPSLGLFTISAPMINQYLEKNELVALNLFHKKTSLHLYLVGIVLFSCLVVGFPFLTELIKNGHLLHQIEPVLWILGISMLFDMATGFNGQIITLSKYYKFGIFVMLLLAVLTIINNFIFIEYTNFKLIGIALATSLSLAIFNGIKIAFNYYKFGVFPLQWVMLKVFLIALIGVLILKFLPKFHTNLFNLVFSPILLLVYFFVLNKVFKIYDLTKILEIMKQKLKKK